MQFEAKSPTDVKRPIVLSGVNITEMGLLTVFQDALASLATEYSERYEIIALVHRKSLFDIPGVAFMEYPEIKRSWLRRLHFEYYRCRRISEKIKPYLWLSMHDITPNVQADLRAVYCHNPSAFYPFRIGEAVLDWKFGLFTLFYRLLYGINIESNDFVLVQQDWIRDVFRSRYRLNNVLVTHPSVEEWVLSRDESANARSLGYYRFFYPAFPRTFKNFEQILRSARRLELDGFDRFEVWLTIDGTETRYAAKMVRAFADLKTVKWLGLIPRSEVMRLYKEADCLLFPSKLETWGMPLTEFKVTRKPILAADLPYAHETIGNYPRAAFFKVDDDKLLSEAMRRAASGEQIFGPAEEAAVTEPFAKNWRELWDYLLRG